MRGDLETARRIQFDLVPGEVFRKSDVIVQARMRPARTVGGDLYDVVDLDDERLAVIVGDVTGKGLPAALLMTSFLGSVRALVSAGLRGSELIRALNRHVCANTSGGRRRRAGLLRLRAAGRRHDPHARRPAGGAGSTGDAQALAVTEPASMRASSSRRRRPRISS